MFRKYHLKQKDILTSTVTNNKEYMLAYTEYHGNAALRAINAT